MSKKLHKRLPSALCSLSLALASLLVAPASFAATVAIYDLNAGTASGTGAGNYYEFTSPVAGVDNLQVYAFSDLASNPGVLTASEVVNPATGLGNCNAAEDYFIAFLNLTLPCRFISAARQPVDNVDGRDWLLFYLPNLEGQGNKWDSVTLQAQGGRDMDVSFWAGDLADPASLVGLDLNSLPASTDVNYDGSSPPPLAIDLAGVEGNALLIGTSSANLDGQNDAFLVSSITTVVPLPPGFLLMGSALLALFARIRRG